VVARRLGVAVVLRTVVTIVLGALAGLIVFGASTGLVLRADAPGWVDYVAPLYLLAGVVAAGYGGLLTALRRETDVVVRGLTARIGRGVSRAVDDLRLPAGGIEPARLRQMALARKATSRSGAVRRALAGFAVGRAAEAAGVGALRDRLVELADDAERRGERVVARDAVTAVAREGVAAAVASRLRLAWTLTRATVLAFTVGLFLSLPLAAALLD